MTEKPQVRVGLSPAGIPDELKKLARWVLWKHEWVEEKKRWIKAPYQCAGTKAKSNDPATWASFHDVLSAVHRYDGIGFVFNGDGIAGIDLDDAVSEDGSWSEKADSILKEVQGYAELSPSGTGLHIITRTSDITKGKSRDGVEAYSSGRYFTFTGHQLNGHSAIPPDPQDIKPFLATYFGDKPKPELTDLDIALAEAPRTFYQKVNALAMKSFAAWVPALFPEAIPYKNGGFRVTSTSLGRALEEDISIVAEGIKDFGVADQDDPREGKRSPIDLVLEWRNLSKPEEAANWICEQFGVTPSALGGKAAEPAEQSSFLFYKGNDYALDFAGAPELVEDVLPSRGIGMLFGPSNDGKSTWALDMAFHIHNGVRWRGKDVIQGDVMYVAAEAGRSIKKRIQAVRLINPEWDAPFIADVAPNLSSMESLKAVRDAARAAGSPAMVVVDTMSASFEGDDSSQQDVAKMMRNLKILADDLECVVMFVHHTTKAGESYRGSGALFADGDFVLELVVAGEGANVKRWITQRKHRDGEAGRSYAFELKVSQPLGYKPNGKPITSVTIEQTDESAPTKQKKERRSTGGEFETSDKYAKARKYLEIISDLAGLGDANIDEMDVISAIQGDEIVNPLKEPDYPRPDNIKRTLLTLADRGKIKREGRWIRVSR